MDEIKLTAYSKFANSIAVDATAELYEAVRGTSKAGDSHGAVVGININETETAGPGVYGKSNGTGVWGESKTWHGVAGFTDSKTGGVGIYGEGREKGMGPAALFRGDVLVEIKSLPHFNVTHISVFDLFNLIQNLQTKVSVLESRIK